MSDEEVHKPEGTALTMPSGRPHTAYDEAEDFVDLILRGRLTVEQARETITVPYDLRRLLLRYLRTLTSKDRAPMYVRGSNGKTEKCVAFSIHDLRFRDAVLRSFEAQILRRARQMMAASVQAA